MTASNLYKTFHADVIDTVIWCGSRPIRGEVSSLAACLMNDQPSLVPVDGHFYCSGVIFTVVSDPERVWWAILPVRPSDYLKKKI